MTIVGTIHALNTVTVAQIVTRLRTRWRDEWAFVDLREVGEAAEGHPFGTTNLPYSTLERDIGTYVPRRGTFVALIDGGDGVASRAARRLMSLGYVNLAMVAGGIPEWQAAGLPLLKGVHTWSKAFGEWVHHHFETPDISPEILAGRLCGANPPLVIDVRPLDEHRRFTIPTAQNCPNAELGMRLPAMIAPDRPIVVHCAGRTRSIIGAQTLRDLGLPNPVLALRDGTQGWELAGFERDIGADRSAPTSPSPQAQTDAAHRARQMMLREGIALLDSETLCRWMHDSARTTYLFDPRSAGDGTVPQGFRQAPGTTLIQQTDRFVAVRGARVVLHDPALSRAAFAALWLRRMGIEAHVLDGPPPQDVASQDIPALLPALAELSAPDLAAHIAAGGQIVDLRPFAAFAANHVAGAIRCPRARLDRLPFAVGSRVALVANAIDSAAFAAIDLAEAGHVAVGVMVADPVAWADAGITMAQVHSGSNGTTDDDRIDEVRFCAGRHAGNLDHARAYLAWETGLLTQLSVSGLMPWPIIEPFDAPSGD